MKNNIKEITTEYNDQLNKSFYLKDKETINLIWNKIKNNTFILNEALNIKINRFKEIDFRADYIVMCMLYFQEDINKEAYKKLIDLIFSNADLARSGVDGCSLLLYAMWNTELELSEEQKAFVIDEVFESLNYTRNKSTRLAKHRYGNFDIRYWILRNNSFTSDEKKEYVNSFYVDDECYDNVFDQWEWDIVNNSSSGNQILIAIDDVLFTPIEEIEVRLKTCFDEKKTQEFIKEIQFVRFMCELREPSWLRDDTKLTLNQE